MRPNTPAFQLLFRNEMDLKSLYNSLFSLSTIKRPKLLIPAKEPPTMPKALSRSILQCAFTQASKSLSTLRTSTVTSIFKLSVPR